jgi:hypothetical protein
MIAPAAEFGMSTRGFGNGIRLTLNKLKTGNMYLGTGTGNAANDSHEDNEHGGAKKKNNAGRKRMNSAESDGDEQGPPKKKFRNSRENLKSGEPIAHKFAIKKEDSEEDLGV